MECRFARWVAVSACAAMLTVVNSAHSAPPVGGGKIAVARSFRASKLEGLHVKNPAGERLGTVDDLVVDVASGKIAYVAMSVGGVLGIGEKLFAVPYGALQFDHGKDEMAFILDTTKAKLEASPGFDKNNWPDFADPKWTEQIDDYYRQAEQLRPAKVLLAK